MCPGAAMEIKGIKHVAEISPDLAINQERFRFSLRRTDSNHIIYWGHEHSERAAIQMAQMYLSLLDECMTSLKDEAGPSLRHVQLIATQLLS